MPDKPPYKVVLESRIQEKKKLRSNISYNETAPNGYTFVPIGAPELADYCKELSRKRGVDVCIVSAKPRNPAHLDPTHISHHIHRIGYHFRNDIVETACTFKGIKSSLPDRPQLPMRQTGHRAIAARMEVHENRLGLSATNVNPDKQREAASLAIRDLFPKLPDKDRKAIITRAFKEGSQRIGTQEDIPLPRRVQLAVLAHIRHTKTPYDSLLRLVGWQDARRAVEQQCLDQIVRWRGEDNQDDGELEDIFEEIIVIDDESDDEADGTVSEDRDESVEIISDQRHAEDVDDYEPPGPEVGGRPKSQNAQAPEIISVKPRRVGKTPAVIDREIFDERLSFTKARVRGEPASEQYADAQQLTGLHQPEDVSQRTSADTRKPVENVLVRSDVDTHVSYSASQPLRHGRSRGQKDRGESLSRDSRPFYVPSFADAEEAGRRLRARDLDQDIRPSIERPDTNMLDAPAHMENAPSRPSGGHAAEPAHGAHLGTVVHRQRHLPDDRSTKYQPERPAADSRQVIDLTRSPPASNRRETRHHPYRRPTSLAAGQRPNSNVSTDTYGFRPAPRMEHYDAVRRYRQHEGQQPPSSGESRPQCSPQRFYEVRGDFAQVPALRGGEPRSVYGDVSPAREAPRPDVMGYGRCPDVVGYEARQDMGGVHARAVAIPFAAQPQAARSTRQYEMDLAAPQAPVYVGQPQYAYDQYGYVSDARRPY